MVSRRLTKSVQENLADMGEVMSQHRNSIPISLRLSDRPELAQCVNDPTMRVMVFCAADRVGMQDIAFPHQAEIKVNGGEIKANLRGLKNKPGSTRPVDITDALRLKTQYTNNVDFTYALTQKACHHPSSKSEAEFWLKGFPDLAVVVAR
jgi:E3 SUMO-protein ligase PIAS1